MFAPPAISYGSQECTGSLTVAAGSCSGRWSSLSISLTLDRYGQDHAPAPADYTRSLFGPLTNGFPRS